MENWFNLRGMEVMASLSVNPKTGLTACEAEKRLVETGENRLQVHRKIAPLRIFFEQFLDFMVLVLLGAAIVSGLLGEKADAVTIIAIIILNAVLGFVQEYRAEKSLEALKELSAPQARVLRDGKVQTIPAQYLVPGDLLLMETGDRIPADGRIIESINLEVNEATLTGESLAVVKLESPLHAVNPSLGDRQNMVFGGTAVVGGRGKAVITATGMKTEIGKIAGLISTVEPDTTPLQQRLEQLGRWLVVLCLGVCAAVGTLGVLRGEPPRQMFLSAVSLAVAAIPEGLPAIVTIALAIGVQKMIRRKAIIRKLPAVETLGCATVICSDKTGTLTQNKLAVTRLETAINTYLIPDAPQNSVNLPFDLQKLLEIAVLCNNATGGATHSCGGIMDDPTEQALLAVADHYGVNRSELDRLWKRAGENPFASERKRMSVWVSGERGTCLLVKGAPDIILERCSRVVSPNGVIPLNYHSKEKFREKVDSWGADALRVLAFAYREGKPRELGRKDYDAEKELILIGLMGMSDPPRPESRTAVEKSRQAGIVTKMITGDYPRTAAAIAKQIGLLRPGGKIITGTEMDRLSDVELARLINEIDVFARVSPHHKLRVVKALRIRGEIVAMTGDGVNDAPAVKEADIGVAMGLGGTDVTKEASDMVLADDNYATIVAAVEEGRVIYDNIRKSVRYLLSSNIGEILTMLGGLVMGLPVPLLPIQILWVNLVTDGLPAIALGMEPAEPGIMKRRPRGSKEGIFARRLGMKIIFQGLMIGLITLAVYLVELQNGNLVMARTAAFSTLVFAQLGFAFRCRSEALSADRRGLGKNPYLIGAVTVSSLMQLGAVNLPWFQRIFYTKGLFFKDWLLIMTIICCASYISDFLLWLQQQCASHWAVFRVNTNRAGGFARK
jgi:Ca2+-transporting ATPase